MKKKTKSLKKKRLINLKRSDDVFHKIAIKASMLFGNVWMFIITCLLIILSIIIGIFLEFSDAWQLVVNLTISIVTFLIVFFIQNSQNRDTKDLRLKLDELIRSHKSARNTIINLDNMSEKGIKELEKQYKKISKSTHILSDKQDDSIE